MFEPKRPLYAQKNGNLNLNLNFIRTGELNLQRHDQKPRITFNAPYGEMVLPVFWSFSLGMAKVMNPMQPQLQLTE